MEIVKKIERGIKMGVTSPSRHQVCMFCEHWDGDAHLVAERGTDRYGFDSNARGVCKIYNRSAGVLDSCRNYIPNDRITLDRMKRGY